MRNLNRGQLLNKFELHELLENLEFSSHSIQRLAERGSSIEETKKAIENPFLAYFNTDGSINIAPTNNKCYVIAKSRYGNGYTVITYKENTHMKMTEKRILATKGIER